jgi:hypothetical protein
MKANKKIYRISYALIILFCFLIVTNCGQNEPVETLVPSTNTPMPPTATDTAVPTATPLPPTPFPTSIPIPGIRTYGGDLTDWAYDIILLSDGGSLITGQTNNRGLSHRITTGNAYLIRTDAEGNVIWEKDYSKGVDALMYNPIQVGDDEYVILGGIAASYTRQEEDMYLIKIDGEGNEIWSQTYGGQGMDTGKMVRQTSDGGFILTGDRADEFPTGDQYENNLVLIKTDAEGNELWSRTYGEKKLYMAWAVVQTPDNGYALTGWEAKTYDDRDIILMKTNEVGQVEWYQSWDLEPGDWDGCNDMILTADGYLVASCIRAMLSERSGVLVKVDLNGTEIWVKEFSEEGLEYDFWDIMEDADDGYVMAGAVIQDRNPVTGEGIRHGLIVKTDPDGNILWKQIFTRDEYEQSMFSSAVVNPDGGYIFVGMAILNGEKNPDMLWLKLMPDD